MDQVSFLLQGLDQGLFRSALSFPSSSMGLAFLFLRPRRKGFHLASKGRSYFPVEWTSASSARWNLILDTKGYLSGLRMESRVRSTSRSGQRK